MAVEKCAIVVMVLVKLMAAENMEGFIVGGHFTTIKDFAHSAYVSIRCINRGGMENYFMCGSSILNQAILLTAAHCFEECEESTIIVHVGHENIHKAHAIPVVRYFMHENYDSVEILNDIALLRLKDNIRFGKTARRVLLMAQPPYHTPAVVAGWGIVDEEKMLGSEKLKFASQHVWSRASCQSLLHKTPVGTFCAGLLNDNDYAAQGDSGSALVVHGFIQIGLVSFKNPSISRSVVVYTDVGHFYHWILRHVKLLYCLRNKHKNNSQSNLIMM